ncbi:hypothetical protein OG331_50005 [Streptomyces sp. NBC_01017]|uniref:hypothetical protein n=1 Tax=Streptomyces sp. NBC_01017 TaxID=2903721 RepID=UPI00386637F3|nr:hypothetical protein OG331_01970 [Streptomyces sp. NBC_01017]WSV35091.1 hypothetical protein OG331_50005 [Streptomyces sp. NBC_01017]
MALALKVIQNQRSAVVETPSQPDEQELLDVFLASSPAVAPSTVLGGRPEDPLAATRGMRPYPDCVGQ